MAAPVAPPFALAAWATPFLLLLSSASGAATRVEVGVDTAAAVSNTSRDYVCVTMDWWPPDKCDYGNCSWANASAFNMDLGDAKLVHAMEALAPVKLRIGGTLADFVAYNVSDPAYCLPQWDFRGGCLSMQRWSAIHDFCSAAGCGVVFGLSELYDRPTDDAPWDPRNARALLEHTRAMPNARLAGLELGNEVGGPHGILAHLSAAQVARDFRALRKMLDDVWDGDDPARPLLIGPDAMIDVQWVGDFLSAVGNDTLDAFTYHLYLDAGSDPALMTKILTPQFLFDKGESRASKMREAVRRRLPRTPLWMGEAGGAYNSGQNTTTNAFVSGFWYLDQLGGFAASGHQAHCRCDAAAPAARAATLTKGPACSQTFCGGNYGLLNVASHEPQPDYWNALLFRSLMGTRVLNVTVPGYPSAPTRIYAHCTRGGPAGAVTVLALNYDPEEGLDVHLPFAGLPRREYVLSAPSLRSSSVSLNGQVLRPGPGGAISVPAGRKVTSGPDLLHLPPRTYGFFVLPAAGATACQ